MTETFPFTRQQWNDLSDEQRQALVLVAEYRGIDPWVDPQADESEDGDEIWEELLQEAFGLWRPCAGCVPAEEIGDDVTSAVREKFACLYGPAMRLAESELIAKGTLPGRQCLRYIIDASYEDSTEIVLVDWYPDERPYCYHQGSCKAWKLCFETLPLMANWILLKKEQLIGNVMRLVKP